MKLQIKKFTKHLKTIAAACLLSTAITGTADAVVLTFDDLASPPSFGLLPAIYQGFGFTNSFRYYDFVGNGFEAHSGGNAGINAGGGIIRVIDNGGSDFTFDGLWAKAAFTPPGSGGADSHFGTLQGYNNGSLVWSVDTSLNGRFEFYGPQAGLIDTLHLDFVSIDFPFGVAGFFQVDDISLNESTIDPIDPLPSAVPVPAALPLFGTGLAIMGFVGWRRKRLATA